MSKNIAISDEVYERLKREKGERSFSELIEERLETGNKLADVTGQQILEAETYEEVSEEIEQLSNGTLDRIDDETA
jgi:predicted CopG family antitoxin